MKKRNRFLVILFMIVLIPFLNVFPCTSFLLKQGDALYFAHSLNQGNIPRVQGIIFLNQRDTWKKGYSWENLLKVNQEVSPNLVWKSKYGSVTFNPMGREFPDGGMNEKGLFIWEMTLDATQYSKDENLPRLFMMQWMQYQLDNFRTVEEVINNSDKIALDGWEWHFFVADKSGKSAAIEFLDGKPVIHTGENMPIPLLCNDAYSDEIRWVKNFKGFGGELEITPKSEWIPRFTYGAKILQDFSTQEPVEYSFNTLDAMSKNVRWAIVFDVNNLKVHFKTNLNQTIRSFSFSSNDFAKTNAPLMLDIECPGPGDVKNQFIPYSKEANGKLLTDLLKLLYTVAEPYRAILKEQNTDNETVSRSILSKMELADEKTNFNIAGDWKGIVKYPAAGKQTADVPMTISFNLQNGILTGKVDDGAVIKNLPIINAEYSGGIINFSIFDSESKCILLFTFNVSEKEIYGTITFNRDREDRKGTVRLSRIVK
jgi:penicillin V acylase-like amidase (Ntn superfamily)